MNYHFSPQIPQEKELAKQIHNALEGDVIDQIISLTGAMEQNDDSCLRASMAVTKLKVEPDIMPKLCTVLQGVREKLGFEREIEFYITNSKEINACTYFGTASGHPLIIDINSALIELMSEDELRFVIGHELGHQIDGNSSLTKLIKFIYPNLDEMSPLLLQLKVHFWQQLCELVADRYGFLAVGDLNVCVSAFFKMHSGLNLKGMNIDIDAFIKHNHDMLRYFTEGKFLSLSNYDHPVDVIRVESLNAFANAANEKELEVTMNELVAAIARVSTTDIDVHLPYFIASAGLMIANADGKIADDEVENILVKISPYDLFPKSILEEVWKGNPVDFFNNSVSEILRLNPNMKPHLFQFIMDQVMVDKKLNIDEINLMVKIGTDVFGYAQEDIFNVFAQSIRDCFRPSFSAIC